MVSNKRLFGISEFQKYPLRDEYDSCDEYLGGFKLDLSKTPPDSYLLEMIQSILVKLQRWKGGCNGWTTYGAMQCTNLHGFEIFVVHSVTQGG